MSDDERDAIKGRVFDIWLDELRRGERPSIPPELGQLSQDDIAEVMGLARWYKVIFYPSSLTAEQSEAIHTSVRARIAEERAKAGGS